MASYSQQADDDGLQNFAVRIQARAIRQYDPADPKQFLEFTHCHGPRRKKR